MQIIHQVNSLQKEQPKALTMRVKPDKSGRMLLKKEKIENSICLQIDRSNRKQSRKDRAAKRRQNSK